MKSDTIRILHVDNDEMFADSVGTYLEAHDDQFVVDVAHSGQAATDDYDLADIDCVVSDYEMPDETGIEFLRRVRAADPALPFILVTGRGSERIAGEAISAGVTDYLQKRPGTETYELLANRIRNAVETARAKAEARTFRDRFRGLSEAFPDVAFYIDDEGRYVDVIAGRDSPLLYDDPESILGERLHDVLSEEIADRFYDVVQQALETGELQTIEYELDVQAGERWFEARVSPLATTLSDRPTVIWVARDITDHKQRQRELERQNNRLEEFTSVVSHDLKNPLQVVQTRVELARDESDSTHLAASSDALSRMERIINDMLWLAREQRDIGSQTSVDLETVFEDSWRIVADDHDDADLVWATNGQDPSVMADYDRLRQLLENLLRNAIDHVGPDVTVQVELTDDGFAIEDDGPGIPAADREHVFDESYSTGASGTGVGLRIARQVAEAHGWTISAVEGNEGGARFEVSGVEFSA